MNSILPVLELDRKYVLPRSLSVFWNDELKRVAIFDGVAYDLLFIGWLLNIWNSHR